MQYKKEKANEEKYRIYQITRNIAEIAKTTIKSGGKWNTPSVPI